MKDLCWDCRVCDAAGVCGKSESECLIYQDYYGFEACAPKTSGGQATAVKERKVIQPATAVKLNESNKGLINRLSGQIVKIIKGDDIAAITIKAGESYVTSMIPLRRFNELGKYEGDTVTVVFKAMNVDIMR